MPGLLDAVRIPPEQLITTGIPGLASGRERQPNSRRLRPRTPPTQSHGPLQHNAGLPLTGIVDAGTRAALQRHRCGVPDGIPRAALDDKYAPLGAKWSQSTVTWYVNNPDDVTQAQAEAAVSAALATWAAQSSLPTFSKASSFNAANIKIQFAAILKADGTPDGPGNVLASTSFSGTAASMTIDTAETWSVATPTPSGSIDLQTVLLHELGHAIGLWHSALATATMYPYVSGQDQTLDGDDDVGISALYDTWVQLPGVAKDIGVGADGSAWVIGTNPVGSSDFSIHKWNGNGWTQTDGGAVRIAVGPTGIPWVVNGVGDIYRRTTNSPTSGSWDHLPGAATDIGVGADGSAWILTKTHIGAGTDFTIMKWDAGLGAWVQADGGAVRIAVGPTGVPWIVNSVNTIYRRTTNSPTSGTWEVLPGLAKDIGISDGSFAWVIGTVANGSNFSIFTWDEQSQILYSDGSVAAPAERVWTQVPGAATNISVGPNGTPWVVNAAGVISRPAKIALTGAGPHGTQSDSVGVGPATLRPSCARRCSGPAALSKRSVSTVARSSTAPTIASSTSRSRPSRCATPWQARSWLSCR